MMGHLIKPFGTLKSIFLQKWSALLYIHIHTYMYVFYYCKLLNAGDPYVYFLRFLLAKNSIPVF